MEFNECKEYFSKILLDTVGTKVVPWRDKKIKSLKVADSFYRLNLKNRALRVKFCGTNLTFKLLADGSKKLHSADFCRDRFCPMCKWRRSLKMFYNVSRVMDYIINNNPNIVPIFLTFTVKNCFADELKSTMDNMFSGFHKLTRRKVFLSNVLGYFRAFEVTYNQEEDTWHPHFHCIFLVDKNYFRKTNKNYLSTNGWAELWKSCCDLDYVPVTYAKKISNKGKSLHKSVAEVAKYSHKDTDFIHEDIEKMDKIFSVLINNLSGRRLCSFGGLMKEVFKFLKLEDAENSENLINIDGEFRTDVSEVLVKYKWNFGLGNYIEFNPEDAPEEELS